MKNIGLGYAIFFADVLEATWSAVVAVADDHFVFDDESSHLSTLAVAVLAPNLRHSQVAQVEVALKDGASLQRVAGDAGAAYNEIAATVGAVTVHHYLVHLILVEGLAVIRHIGYTHIADSAALFKYDFGTMDAVRVGTALAGRVAGGAVPGLMKVGYIKAGVEEVGWFPKKHRIGGQTLKKPARLAVLSVGFYNGFGVNRPDYERRLIDILKARKRRPVVKLGGRKLRIIGNVGLQHTIVDVTDIECSVGDACYLDVDPVNVKGLQRTYISHEEK